MVEIINSKNDGFAYFDELQIYQQIYSGTGLMPRKIFYEIATPFLMDSQCATWLDERLGLLKGRKRKRRQQVKQQQEENGFSVIFENMRVVQQIHNKFLSVSKNYAMSPSLPIQKNVDIGNKEARHWVKNAPMLISDPDFDCGSVMEIGELGLQGTSENCTKKKIPKLWMNKKDEFMKENFHLIPPKSAYLLGDISLVNRFPEYGQMDFDFVVIDPPWPNRTVKRQKSYKTIGMTRRTRMADDDPTLEKIWQLPMSTLLHRDGLLCIWVTNSRTSKELANQLIGHWSLAKVAEWHWLKVCKSGEPVCPFRAEHKVPFENIIFACKSSALHKFTHIPDKFCLISVPNACPSRKPPISILLERLALLGPVQKGLELFARFMLPNFTSVGFEATKFQEEYFFERPQTQEECGPCPAPSSPTPATLVSL